MPTPAPHRPAPADERDAHHDAAGAYVVAAATAPARRARPVHALGRRRLVALAVVVAGLAAVGALVAALLPPPPPSTTVAGHEIDPEAGFVDLDRIERRTRLARGGTDPYDEALADLVVVAWAALDEQPRPVEELHWEGRLDTPFFEDALRAYTLGLAYQATNDVRFAWRAAQHVRSWSQTLRHVHDACPHRGDCHNSLVVSRAGPGFVFAAQAIEGSGQLSETDERRFQAWLRRVILPAASERENNWGDAGTFMRAAITSYVGDRKGFAEALADWRDGIDRIRRSGAIPEEIRRGRDGMMYTQEALTYKVALATLADQHGIDLWSYRGDRGATLQRAIDFLADHWDRPERWPYHERPRVPTPGPMWELAYAAQPEQELAPIVRRGRPFGDRGNSAVRWVTITHGIPLGQEARAWARADK